MGTFHQDTHELHGITVVVDTDGEETWVGRCDDMNDREIILLDADRHREGEDDRSREEYLRRAADFGVWKKFDRVSVPRGRVTAVRPLGDL